MPASGAVAPARERDRAGRREAHDDRREQPACAQRCGERAEPAGAARARERGDRAQRVAGKREHERDQRRRHQRQHREAQPFRERERQREHHDDGRERERVGHVLADQPADARPAAKRLAEQQRDEVDHDDAERERQRDAQRLRGRRLGEALRVRRDRALEARDHPVAGGALDPGSNASGGLARRARETWIKRHARRLRSRRDALRVPVPYSFRITASTRPTIVTSSA